MVGAMIAVLSIACGGGSTESGTRSDSDTGAPETQEPDQSTPTSIPRTPHQHAIDFVQAASINLDQIIDVTRDVGEIRGDERLAVASHISPLLDQWTELSSPSLFNACKSRVEDALKRELQAAEIVLGDVSVPTGFGPVGELRSTFTELWDLANDECRNAYMSEFPGTSYPLEHEFADAGASITPVSVTDLPFDQTRYSSQQITGSGDSVQPINLSPGLVLFDGDYRGSANFAVWLRGESDDLLVNTIGRYLGTTAASTGGGTFLLDITASGSWNFVIRHPLEIIETNESLFTGSGDGTSSFVALNEGLHVVSSAHAGDSNFAVWLIDERGTKLDLIANEIGDYEGATSVRISESGNYMTTVEADGFWVVAFD